MAGDEMQSFTEQSQGNMTIISPNEKVAENGHQKYNNNGVEITNGQVYKKSNANNKIVENMEERQNGFQTVEEVEVSCGWGRWTPRWLQGFATKQVFLAAQSSTWVLQGMFSTYIVSVITTIEKLFQIQSKTTGTIMAATEIGQISSSMLLTYYLCQGHRPKWIARSMVLFALSSFACSLPHFIFGEQLMRQNKLLISGIDANNEFPGLNATNFDVANLCRFEDKHHNSSFNSWAAGMPNASHENPSTYCEERSHDKTTYIVSGIFFFSLLGVGLGQTAVYTLGIPYIDDNVTTRESPLYFATTIGVKILGPALGFILGSFCTRLYVDLSADPQITPSDPRWVGAWWLGLILIPAMLLLVSIAMFAFPIRLPGGRSPKNRNDSKKPNLRDFPKTVMRLLKNKLLMCKTVSSVLHILPIAGLYTFLPKYLESQFRLPAHNANMISGVGGILVMGIGIVISGFFILRIKPSARFVAGWIAFTAIVFSVGMFVLMFVGCSMNSFAGLTKDPNGKSYFQPTCEVDCECDRNKFSPVCGIDGKTYFSACNAGCTNYTIVDGKMQTFFNCQCTNQNNTLFDAPTLPASATIGYCDNDCTNFWIYMALFSFFVLIHATGEVGSMLLILRSVDTRDKAMALSLIQFAIGLFGNVPCPIIYGSVVDTACLVWEFTSGDDKGACRLYDSELFRKHYHGTTGGIMLLAFVVDIVVCYIASSLSFADEQRGENGLAEEMTTLRTQDSETVFRRRYSL